MKPANDTLLVHSLSGQEGPDISSFGPNVKFWVEPRSESMPHPLHCSQSISQSCVVHGCWIQ